MALARAASPSSRCLSPKHTMVDVLRCEYSFSRIWDWGASL
jgi:hypothetical protein